MYNIFIFIFYTLIIFKTPINQFALLTLCLASLSSEAFTDTIYKETFKEKDLKPLSYVQAKYPSAAQRKGTEGYTIISFTVTKKGTTENAIVVEAKCGDINSRTAIMRDCLTFNASSLNAAKKLRYRPTEVNGIAVEVDNVLYRFRYEMGGKRKTKPILNIPSRDLYMIQSWISGKKLDKAEKKSLELLSNYEDVNFLLGKIYALKKQDALAIEHFNRFLNIDYGDSSIKSLRNTLEISAVAIIVEKLFKVEDYKGIIALAPKINNSFVLLGSRSDAQDKNANNLIDLSYFYLGASYLMEGDIELGREALLFAKKRTKDKKFLKAINNYLLQVE